MKQNQFSQEQIIHILQLAEQGQKTIGQICREAGYPREAWVIAEITITRKRVPALAQAVRGHEHSRGATAQATHQL
jgi:hypothetical protein